MIMCWYSAFTSVCHTVEGKPLKIFLPALTRYYPNTPRGLAHMATRMSLNDSLSLTTTRHFGFPFVGMGSGWEHVSHSEECPAAILQRTYRCTIGSLGFGA